jgi:RecA-family ATPase
MASTLYDLYRKPLPENPSWVSGGVVPKGGIIVMGGPDKIGKSWLVLDLAESLAAGGRLWDTEYDVKSTGTVLIMEREIGVFGFQERTKLRYGHLGYPPNRNIFYTSKMKGLLLDTDSGLKLLDTEIQATGARIVFIDPVSMAMNGEENSNTDVQHLINNLRDVQVDYPELTFILTHHYGKRPKGQFADDYDPLERENFRGAKKWVDAADTLITFHRTESKDPDVWWKLDARFTLRHGPNPKNDFKFLVLKGGIIAKAAAAVTTGGLGRWKK